MQSVTHHVEDMERKHASNHMGGKKSKFLPPVISSTKIVYRTGLIENELHGSSRKQFIFIEAQAGQGKTTTALQYVHKTDRPFAWYQVGEEDCDPLFFFSSIIESIKFNLFEYSSNSIRKSLSGSDIAKTDLPEALDQLIDSLNALKPMQLNIVFDDLHLVNVSPSTLTLLDSLLDSAPENISFLLLSRYPVPLQSRKVKFGGKTLYLTNNDLAFSLQETVELFNKFTGTAPSHKNIQDLHFVTEGWVMGLILAKDYGGKILHRSKKTHRKNNNFEELRYYFEKELLDGLCPKLQNDLLKLSLLEDIPVSLAIQITKNTNLGSNLDELMDNNHFIRLTDDDIETYSFHHLMREVLRTKFLTRFSEQDRIEILKTAIDYYLAEDSVERAVVYVLRLNFIFEVELFLENYGLELVARNRLGTLRRIPEELNEKSLGSFPWIQFFQGIILAESEPEAGVQHLIQSVALFKESKNRHGRLLALSQVVYHYVLTASYLEEESVSAYLEEAVEVYHKIHDDLPTFSHIFICRNIGAGNLVFNLKIEKSRLYLGRALKLAQKEKIPNMIVSSWVFLGYSYSVPGLLPTAQKIAESLYRYISNVEIGNSNKAFAHHFLTDLLEMTGDFLNYTRTKAKYSALLDSDIIAKTQMGPSVSLWDIKFHIARDELDRAKNLIDESAYSGPLYNTAHIKSRMLENKSFVTALSGGSLPEITSLVKESAAFRKKSSWGGFFSVRNYIYSGIALSLAGDRKIGEQWLTKGIDEATRLNIPTLEVSGYMLRAYSTFLTGDKDKALDDLNSGLTLMRRHNYDMFWGWYPKIMLRLLTEAAKAGIESAYIKKICHEKFHSALTEKGEIFPCLVIQLLGNFQFSIAGKVIASTTDFTPMQRLFLTAVLSSTNNELSQEKVQSILWPDVSREKAKRNFDTFISRLRSLLRPLISPGQINNFLVVHHGMVSFQHCRVDALELSRHIKQGMAHADNDDFWQAENSFTSARNLWKGCFALDVLLEDIAYDYCIELRNSYSLMVECWTATLLDARKNNEAQIILLETLKTYPSHERITALLYYIYLLENDAESAKMLLKKYRKVLQQQEMSDLDIQSLIETITSNSPIISRLSS